MPRQPLYRGPGAACSSLLAFDAHINAADLHIWAALAVISAVGQSLEQQTPLGRVASAPVLTMGLAAAAAAAHAIPTACSLYDVVWSSVMPLGAALCLLEVDLTNLARLWADVGPATVAFAIGSVGVVAGTLLGWWLLGPRLGSEGAKVAAALCASYIGGSINFAATAAALGLAPGKLLAGAMAVDNIAMALYLAVMSSWPVTVRQPREAAAAGGGSSARTAAADDGSLAAADQSLAAQPALGGGGAIVTRGAAMGLPAAALAVWAGDALAGSVGFEGGNLALMAVAATAIAAAASAFASKWQIDGGHSTSPFTGSSTQGAALLLPFFATIGAAAGSLDAVSNIGWLFCLIAVQLITHVAIIVGGSRMLRLPMDAVLTASNASVGGPGTAAATAAARKWPHMMQPAVLIGSLGYAVGTAVGCGMGRALGA